MLVQYCVCVNQDIKELIVKFWLITAIVVLACMVALAKTQ
jgi:hypothetical protein